MQTHTTHTATDATTNAATEATETRPTLADLIAEYRAKEQADNLLIALDHAQINGTRFELFQTHLENTLPADLYNALNFTFHWYGDPFCRYGTYPYAAFTVDGEQWKLTNPNGWYIACEHDTHHNEYGSELAETLIKALARHEERFALTKQAQYLQLADYPDMTSEEIPF